MLRGVLEDPALVKSWAEIGVSPYPENERSPEAAQALMSAEVARWSEVVRENNIQPTQ